MLALLSKRRGLKFSAGAENCLFYRGGGCKYYQKEFIMILRICNFHYSNVYLLVLSSWKVNIAENPIFAMGLKICSGSKLENELENEPENELEYELKKD